MAFRPGWTDHGRPSSSWSTRTAAITRHADSDLIAVAQLYAASERAI
jgi:hypothetical protein